MILENVLRDMKIYRKEKDKLDENYKKDCDNVYKNYTGSYRQMKLDEIEKTYINSVANIKYQFSNKANELFDSVKDDITGIITDDLPADFNNTLQIIEINKPTELESQMYFDKYKACYPAMRGLINIYHKNHMMMNIEVVQGDNVINTLEDLRKKVIEYYDRNAYTYDSMALTGMSFDDNYPDDKGEFERIVSEDIEPFVNGAWFIDKSVDKQGFVAGTSTGL
ncbi:MAG: hypothetical protein LUH02_01240 [Erysipelotrichaceae bacterium]|nr:hypothetical protein [Erysipelotrichaceae bacterium]